MVFTEFDDIPSHINLPGRVALILAHANIDAKTHLNAVSFASFTRDAINATDWVDYILAQSPNEWKALLDHRFPVLLADGTAALNGFRRYVVQDAAYLEYYYRFQMEGAGKSGTFDDLKKLAAKLSGSFDYVANFRLDCTNKLGVPPDVVETESKRENWSTALKNSINLYISVANSGDWLDIHGVFLPCILGYDEIFKGLRGKPGTVRNTLYDVFWIEANAASSSGAKYRTFINNAINSLPEPQQKPRADALVVHFKKACVTESAFLDLGLDPANYHSYDVVATDGTNPLEGSTIKTGTYTIRTDKGYLTIDGSSVTIGSTAEKWQLTNDKNGFSIKLKDKFLNVTAGGTDLSYPVTPGSTAQYWSINSIPAYSGKVAQKAFQVFAPGHLQFALDARSQTGPKPKVVVTNNSGISDQIWVIEAATQ